MSDHGPLQKESMTVSWVKGVQLAVQVRKHRFVVDQPVEDGGQDEGITPVEMLVASLGTCIGYFAVRFCQRHKIQTQGLKVSMEWDYAEQPHRIGSMTAHVNLPVTLDSALKNRLEKVLESCTVHNSITLAPKISIRLATLADQRA
jgi:uncharacterized OsmC-like protein